MNEEKKKFKFFINGIKRSDETLTLKQIQNKLRQKWVETAIKDSSVFRIVVNPLSYVDDFIDGGKWCVSHSEGIIITLEDCNGKKQIYNIDKLINERYTKDNEKILKDLEERGIEFLQCPYCGRKLERIKDKESTLKPTSCTGCNHHNFTPNVKRFLFLKDCKESLNTQNSDKAEKE